LKKLIIIHFNNIEKYPPALNLIEYLSNKNIFDQIIIFSRGKLLSSNSKINFKISKSYDNSNISLRFISYLLFYIKCLFTLFSNKPEKVIYYESLSFFPVFIYKIFFPAKKIFCHYHEYETKEDYLKSMLLNRINHFFEKKCYSNYDWISHTNNYRLDFFLKDNLNVNPNISHIMPNYPPKSWYSAIENRNINKSEIINFVFVGALSFKDMYLKEFIIWILNQNGKARLTLFSNNLAKGVIEYLESLKSDFIDFKGSVPYFDLPHVLRQYDVGVILYMCKVMNTIYCEPNKFFEYYSCGLDVWFPKEMLGMNANTEIEKRPYVIAVDFENLKSLDELIPKSNDWNQKLYVRENAFLELESVLNK
jgi:hypothetical protein